MVAVVCIVRPERVDTLLDAAFKVVERHVGVVSVGDCEVLRAERFRASSSGRQIVTVPGAEAMLT